MSQFESILNEKLGQQASRPEAEPTRVNLQFAGGQYLNSENCAEYFSFAQENLNRGLLAAKSYLQQSKKKFESFQADFKAKQAAAEAIQQASDIQKKAKLCLEKESLNPAGLLAAELMSRQGAELQFPLAQAELKTAFRTLVKKTHPDLSSDGEKTVQAFRDVTQAYNVLLSQFPKAA